MAKVKVTANTLASLLVGTDKVSRLKNGNFKFYKGFFYTHGYCEDKYAAKLAHELEAEGYSARAVDTGEVWLPFKGGAPLTKQSHWWVEMEVKAKDAQ